ncbi:M16 family metallopeptidase [Armatimonas sp.]|uniref:M16 family metallopeptidase n=1 Tax=Armatimonas sp. TaxID=1872638 RepID=UPI0037507281
MVENVSRTVLPNGVRVVTENIPTVQSVSVGLWASAGSRDEEPRLRGISHFLEHMFFKGTERRPSAKEIADEMDALGGYLNAFTDKEFTCYYARVLSEHLPVGLDILTDMLTGSLFDPDETAKERKVVLEEIKRRDDDPEDMVHDLFAETIYPNHALGLPVIGSVETVSAFTPEDLRGYIARRYGPKSLVVAAAGNLEHAAVVALAEQMLGGLVTGEANGTLTRPVAAPGKLLYSRPTEQVNFCVGVDGYGQHDAEKYPLAILDNILGGSMGARLFQEIREKRGLAYSVGSYSATHREGGYFAAYGGTSPENFEECLDLVRAEFEKVRKDGVSEAELQRSKNQFRGALIMAQESMSSRMTRLGKSELYFDQVVPLAEALAKIDAVTVADVLAVAQAILPKDSSKLTIAAIGPFEEADKEALAELEGED